MADARKTAKNNTTKKVTKRRKKDRGRLKLTYAKDLGLKCKSYRAGTKEACGKPAEYFEPGLGDVCADHKRSERAIRYARRPKADSQAAA